MEKRSRHSESGFTMIEVMVSILLTAIATSGIIGLYMVETRSSGFTRHTTEATILGQDQIEILRTTTVTGSLTVPGLNEHGVVVAGGIYTRTYQVTASTGYDDLVVTVQWDENGDAKSVVLRSRRNQ